jgi:hypothetical protein
MLRREESRSPAQVCRSCPSGNVHTLPTVTLYCVSPKISARARERYRLSASKSDSFDAFVFADTLRHELGAGGH